MPPTETDSPPSAPASRNLREVALVFLRLGTTAFGGPAAHVGMMEDEFVRRRRWVTHERFLDMLGAVNLIPGPNSTEMAIYLGYLRAGWIGLVLGGVCFIVPAMLIVMALAWAYVAWGSLPQISGALYGVKPVVIAIIMQALWGLGPRAVKTLPLAALAAGALAVAFAGLDPLSLMLACGLWAACWRGAAMMRRDSKPEAQAKSANPDFACASGFHAGLSLAILLLAGVGILALIQVVPRLHIGSPFTARPEGLAPIFFYFLKIGAVLYGTGYVLVAFLQGDLVPGWLSARTLLDAVAVGQVTPGPLFTTATFIGFLLGYDIGGPWLGVLGAVLATIGIFLPSFLFIAVGSRLFPRMRESPVVGAFLDGANVAALALIAVAALQLGRDALLPNNSLDYFAVVLAVISGLLLIRFRINSAWLVLGGAVAGLVAKMW